MDDSWYSSSGVNAIDKVFMKAPFDLFDQHRSGSQVDLSGRYFNVAHVPGEPGKPCVYVLTIQIPSL
jgi:hypothetical protein